MLGAGCWMLVLLDAGYWILDAGCWMLDAGCWILDAGYWMLMTTALISLNLNYLIMKTAKRTSKSNKDLDETKDDKKHLQPDEANLDLPGVEDIPGQEHIHPPKFKEFADTTISSDDEEGAAIFDEEDEIAGKSNVTAQERRDLKNAAEKSGAVVDDINLEDAQLDDRDEDGELLNEGTDVSGSDLDVPGSEEDDKDEVIGEEDEENNSYSLDSEDEDDSTSKQ
jgi:hypothetical protein